MRNCTRLQCVMAGETPDENDLFPSTPLDEQQLKELFMKSNQGNFKLTKKNISHHLAAAVRYS